MLDVVASMEGIRTRESGATITITSVTANAGNSQFYITLNAGSG
jgi:hypothetical protein